VKLLRNYLYLSGAEVAGKVATFAAVAYLARVLGLARYGYVEFAGAVLLCAGLIVEQGFGPYGARELAKNPGRTRSLVVEIVVVRVVLAVVAIAGILAFTWLFRLSTVMTQLLLIYSLSLLATPLLLQWVFQAHSRMDVVAALQILRQVVYAAVIFAFVRRENQIWLVAVAEIAAVTTAAAVGLWAYRRQFGPRIRAPLVITRRLFLEGVPIGLSQALWMIRMFGATVIVGVIAVPQDVGFFGAAQRILIALHAFIWLYYFNLLPGLSHAWTNDSDSFRALINRSLHDVAWLCSVAIVVWLLLAPLVMTTVYGSAFSTAGPVLQWLAGMAVAAALSGHYRFGLIAAGRQNGEMMAQALGTACALIAIPLGYRLLGPTGVAVGLTLSEVIVWLITWWMGHAWLGLAGPSRLLAKPLISTILVLTLPSLLHWPGLLVRLVSSLGGVLTLAWVLDRGVRERVQQLSTAASRWLRSQLAKPIETTP
jgi:PST family polysaccharide transporter